MCEVSQMTEKKESKLKKLFELREMSMILIIIVSCVILALSNEHFVSWQNAMTVMSSMAVNGIMTIGMILVMISGGLDLSIGSVMCLSMTIMSSLIKKGIAIIPAILIGLAVAAMIGALIGLLVTKLKLSHFIVTLCFLGIARGAVYAITSGLAISLLTELLRNPTLKAVGAGYIAKKIPICFIIFLVMGILVDIFCRKSGAMRKVYYTGSNEMAAKHSGIKTDRVKVAMCIACSVFAGIASIIYMSKYNGITVGAGEGAEMTALSAAVIGGVSMNGGKGSITGGLLGLFFIVLIQDALNLFSVQAFWQDLIRYLIVLLAVIIDVFQENARQKKNS